MRDDEEELGHRSRAGKGREWDGRGSGVKNWNTLEEEDVWESKLDFGYDEQRRLEEMKFTKDYVEMRYVKAEREKEVVSSYIVRTVGRLSQLIILYRGTKHSKKVVTRTLLRPTRRPTRPNLKWRIIN